MVKICVTGCLHGELDRVYADVAAAERAGQFKTDLLLCCGDFQSLRNPADLASMSVPPKYYAMGDFWRYYSEELRAPVLTLFIGGNHEASGYLQELPYGGWVAPNIWYMGYAGVVQYAGLRIAGLSGIYKQHDYTMGHYEHPPYSEATKRSVYHVRNLEVFRLGQIRRRVDIVLSHDWPRGIYHYGDTPGLISNKRHFRDEIDSDTLGSPPAEQLFCRLRPRYWFSAHLHCKFAAVVEHADSSSTQSRTTRFLALDKCLPNRDYLQFVDIEPELPVPRGNNSAAGMSASTEADRLECSQSSNEDDDDPFIVSATSEAQRVQSDEYSTADEDKAEEESTGLYLDPEWLCILRSTNHLMSTSKVPCILPTPETKERCDFSATSEEIRALYEPFGNEFAVPDNFERTAPVYKPNDVANDFVGRGRSTASSTPQSLAQQASTIGRNQQLVFSNPQTELLCAMLDLVNPNALLLGRESYSLMELSSQLEAKLVEEVDEDENEELEDDDEVAANEEQEPTGLDGTEPVSESPCVGIHEESGYSVTTWASEHGEYDPLNSTTASSPSQSFSRPPPANELSTSSKRLSVSRNPEEVSLDEVDDDDDDDDDGCGGGGDADDHGAGVDENTANSDASPGFNYSTDAYSPQPVTSSSSYTTGMADPNFQPLDDADDTCYSTADPLLSTEYIVPSTTNGTTEQND